MSAAVPSRRATSIPGKAPLKRASSVVTLIPPAGSSAPIAIRPRTSPRSSVDLVAHAVELGDHPPRPGGDRLPGLGRRDPPAGALEELGAELGLEPADLVRERRLRDVQLLGGAGEVAMAGDGLDVGELAQLHRRLIVYHDQSVDNKILHRLIGWARMRPCDSRPPLSDRSPGERAAGWRIPVTLRLAGPTPTRPRSPASPSCDSRPAPAAPRLVAERARAHRGGDLAREPARRSPTRFGRTAELRRAAALPRRRALAAASRTRRRSRRASHGRVSGARGAEAARDPSPTIRRELRPGDLGRIVAHHGAVYAAEYGVDSTFEAHVAASVAAAGKRGFPREREGIWIVEVDGAHAGSVALTDEGDGLAALRWVVLDPAAARARTRPPADRRGARRAPSRSATRRSAWRRSASYARRRHIYRAHGFEVRWEETGPRWGRDEITYQRYELSFQVRAQSSSPPSTGSSERPFSVSA